MNYENRLTKLESLVNPQDKISDSNIDKIITELKESLKTDKLLLTSKQEKEKIERYKKELESNECTGIKRIIKELIITLHNQPDNYPNNYR